MLFIYCNNFVYCHKVVAKILQATLSAYGGKYATGTRSKMWKDRN